MLSHQINLLKCEKDQLRKKALAIVEAAPITNKILIKKEVESANAEQEKASASPKHD